MRKDWVAVVGFPGYYINPLGQILNDPLNRLLVTRYTQYGFPYVGLTRDHQQQTRSLPRLVALHFVEKPDAFESERFDTPIQLDGDRTNCRADNLMWRPRWYATRYNNQFKSEANRYENPINAPVRVLGDSVVHADSFAAACYYGLLEREVVLSVLQNTYTWPTFQKFELANAF